GSGEALSIIARKYVVPVFRIQRINKIEDARRIRVGQKLRVITGESEVFVDKSDYVLTVFMDKKFISRYEIGIGKDDGTPEGAFHVVTKDWNPDWYYQGKRYPFGDPQNILGVAWLGLDAPSGSASIGIHGSPDGDGIGKKSSKGCIRLRNPDVAEVYDWVTIGSAVTIAQ
ncbi:MAG TPA: L,D-transpeptidase family protein, partial [Planctomycetota bacterium]|nr:L,D-transpeptidase family protein [Planctomycetota bacterium]